MLLPFYHRRQRSLPQHIIYLLIPIISLIKLFRTFKQTIAEMKYFAKVRKNPEKKLFPIFAKTYSTMPKNVEMVVLSSYKVKTRISTKKTRYALEASS